MALLAAALGRLARVASCGTIGGTAPPIVGGRLAVHAGAVHRVAFLLGERLLVDQPISDRRFEVSLVRRVVTLTSAFVSVRRHTQTVPRCRSAAQPSVYRLA